MSTKTSTLEKPTKEQRINNFCVVGAGIPRTGTTSLTDALNILGLGPCYHMSEVIKYSQQHVWKTVAEIKAQGKRVDWDRVFSGKHMPSWRSACDFPVSAYYPELIEFYPNSKVILTLREPAKWYDSFYETVAKTSRHHPEHNCLFDCVTWPIPHGYMDKWGSSPIPQRFFSEEALSTKENAIKAYNDWTEEVKRKVPEDRLLVFHPRMGWEPLCEFLGVPIPEEPFPNSNTREEMKKREKIIMVIGVIQLILFPLLIPIWIVFWWQDGFRDVESKEVSTKKGTRIEIRGEAGGADKTISYLEVIFKAGENLGITLETQSVAGSITPQASNSCTVQLVEAQSVAGRAGVKSGFVIFEVDGRPVACPEEFRSAIKSGFELNKQCAIAFNREVKCDPYDIEVEMKNFDNTIEPDQLEVREVKNAFI